MSQRLPPLEGHNPARWAVATALGLSLGLAMGMVARAAPAADDPVVARVNAHAIHLSEVYGAVETLPLGDQIDVRGQIERFTESVVTEEMLFQWVLGSNGDGESKLRQAVRSFAVERLIETQVKARVAVSDAEIRRYYEKNRDVVRGLHVRVRQILLKSRGECESLLPHIATEQDFARLAREKSLHRASAQAGGDMGYLMPTPGPNWAGFEMALFQMGVGEMRVFDSRQGCHLVRITEVLDPPDPTYGEIAAFVRPLLERQKEGELLQALIARAARAVKVERIPPAN